MSQGDHHVCRRNLHLVADSWLFCKLLSVPNSGLGAHATIRSLGQLDTTAAMPLAPSAGTTG